MKYNYKCKIAPWDFWILSMKKTYTSPVGLVNIIFTLAMIGLLLRFYSQANDILQFVMILLALIFPVFQPIFVYFKAKGQTSLIPANMELTIDEIGLLVTVGAECQQIPWKRVKGIIKESNMVVLRVDERNGYFLTNRVLKNERDSFIEFVEGKL